ncbi:MAG: DegT/DnrJ/EryC1/StrS family aminotransferase [Ignavibacteria bacterium]|nr:DegT/DnrJ/EryC1/StrS family aminotransferase [Ignavibacteria bacterium]
MEFIPVNEPLLSGNEKKYLNECIDTGWISSEGPFVNEFEKKFAAYCGRKYGVAVCNGTAALEAAMISLDLKKDDEVIMPSFTIISCASAIIRAGGTPVLTDSDPHTWNMNPDEVRKKITSRTKAIMAVHIYGLPVDMDPVLKIADEYGLKVIEDAAELIGQTYKGKMCGSFGNVSTFSFYPNKHITTGEGGMILTDDAVTAEKCRSLRNLCFKPGKRFVHDELGYNFRMTNLQAALGVAQFEQIDNFMEKKKYIGRRYTEELKEIDCIQIPLEETDYSRNIYWVYGILLKKEAGMNSEEIMKILADRKIGTRPFFYPMHKQPVFKKAGLFNNEEYPVSDYLGDYGFYIPSGLGVTDEQINRVSEQLKEILK